MDVDETESVDSFDSGSEKDMDETDDYIAPGGKSAKGKKPRIAKSKPSKTSKIAAAAGGSTTAAKARTASTTLTKKSKGAATVRGGARVMVNKAELEIKDDINLFNSLKNSEVAVQAVVDDWVVEYQSEPGPALVELINFVIRCCGCNSTVDEAAVMDLDNVVDALEQVQEQFKKSPNPSYPIVSRAPAFKKFKSSLAEFFERLVMTASDSELLLTAPITAQSSELVAEPPLINVLKEWLSSFSSSTFRSFRHTSTFIVLHIVRATASLVITKRQNVESIRKQRDAEKKKPRVDKTRVKALDDKWREAKEEDATLMDGIRDFIDR
jgi:cohesin complex subunit SA-1/2